MFKIWCSHFRGLLDVVVSLAYCAYACYTFMVRYSIDTRNSADAEIARHASRVDVEIVAEVQNSTYSILHWSSRIRNGRPCYDQGGVWHEVSHDTDLHVSSGKIISTVAVVLDSSCFLLHRNDRMRLASFLL